MCSFQLALTDDHLFSDRCSQPAISNQFLMSCMAASVSDSIHLRGLNGKGHLQSGVLCLGAFLGVGTVNRGAKCILHETNLQKELALAS